MRPLVHGGDIGNAGILRQLEAIAPVTAVRGNNDSGAWADAIQETETIEFEGVKLYVIHDVHELTIDLEAGGIRVLVSGHSHRPNVEQRGGVLHVNPGSAGPRRFKLPVSVAELVIEGGTVSARVVELAIG